MKKRLDVENPFFDFMGKLGDVVILNLLFIICSIPIITMGASVSAMYETVSDMRGECFVSSSSSFRKALKKNFRKSLPAWMIQLAAGCVLVFDLLFVTRAGNALIWQVSGMILGGMMLIWLMGSCYLLPTGVYKERGVKDAFARSFYLAVRNLPYTLLMVLLNCIPGICLILGEYFIGLVTPIYMTIGFGVIAYLNTMLLEHCKEVH